MTFCAFAAVLGLDLTAAVERGYVSAAIWTT
jgi:hypothetical protein